MMYIVTPKDGSAQSSFTDKEKNVLGTPSPTSTDLASV